MTNEKLIVVRTNKIEAGKRYMVAVHGQKPVWMVADKVPTVPLSKMTSKDAFVFKTSAREIEFKTHGTGGPQFLVTKVEGKRGDLVNARVTFYNKKKDEKSEPEQAAA